MNKVKKVETVVRMICEMNIEATCDGGFNEFDQAETGFMASREFLNEVSHKGLDMFMDLIESATHGGVNRHKALSEEELQKACWDNTRRIREMDICKKERF